MEAAGQNTNVKSLCSKVFTVTCEFPINAAERVLESDSLGDKVAFVFQNIANHLLSEAALAQMPVVIIPIDKRRSTFVWRQRVEL